MKREWGAFSVCLSILLLGASAALADELATLTGYLTDPNGLRVPNVTVQLTNVDTNIKYSGETNDEGLYRVSSIPAGSYRVVVQKTGFKTIVKQGVELHVQDVIALNFQLEVGSVAESVTVEAGASMINTTSASVSTVVDQTYIKNMPLNGRSFQDLILLTPGIVPQGFQVSASGGYTGVGGTGEFSVNGQRTESNNYTVDGVSANVGATALGLAAGGSGSLAAATALGTTQALVSVDTLQEFRVQSSTYSAEYGRNPGGQFAFETKSGTNQWHGTAYDYLRNGVFDASDWFNGYFGLKASALRQNDFGGTLGGPVRIPALYNGKDRTFFFVSYEGLRVVAPQPPASSLVPDNALRANTPSPLNQVLNAFPVQSPNGIDDTANGVAQFIGTWSNPSSLNSTSVRFDHVVNDKLRAFFRFSDTASNSATRLGPPRPFSVSMTRTGYYTLRTYTAGTSSVFSSRLSNDFRLNFSSNEVMDHTLLDALGGGAPVDLTQFTGLGTTSETQLFFFLGPNRIFMSQWQNAGAQRQWNFVDTVSLSLGRHQFKFGLDYRRLAPFDSLASPDAEYLFFGASAVKANRGFAAPIVHAPAYPLYKNFSAFAQDEWRVSPRLSVSLGLRWDVNPSPGVTRGLMPYTIQGSGPDNWTLAPQGTPLWRTTWYNFAPRLGAAYVLRNAPRWETVVRGGGGAFFDTGQQLGAIGFDGPGFRISGFQLSSFPGNPAAFVPSIVNPPAPPYDIVYGFSPHLQQPYTLQWNASIEQALGKSQALTASYVASHAARLLQQNVFRPANNPVSGEFHLAENGLTSDYDSLQIQFRRRLSRGVTALASYTWSHCIDYGSQNYLFGYQRGNCDFDVRHNFSGAFSYDLPNVGHNGFVNAVLHHWGLDNRFFARTAAPTALIGNGVAQPNGRISDEGVNFVPDQPVYLYGAKCDSVLQGLGNLAPGKGCPGGRAINPNAFTAVDSGPGDTPRNFARGFGAWQMNLAARRDFPIHERLKLQFRAEAFNVFNHPNFGAINPFVGQRTFGQATGTLANTLGVLNPLYQGGGPRSMQFALKLVF